MPGPEDEPTPNLLDLPAFADDAEETVVLRARRRARPGRRRALAAAAGLVALLAIAATAVALLRPPVTYATAPATTGALSVTVAATGAIAGAVYDINFSGSGRIATIDVALGQQVAAGQRLATLDATSLQDAVDQAQAGVAAAQTALDDATTAQAQVQAQAQAQVTAAYDQEQVALYACDHPTAGQQAAPDCKQLAQDQYAAAGAQASAQEASAQGQVDAAQAQLQAAQAALQTAQHNLGDGTLTAPHAGTVAAINGTVGGTPGAGAATPGVFIALVDLSVLQVQATVAEADVGAVAAGQRVTFAVEAYAGRTFQGTVEAVSPLPQAQGQTVRYPVTITVDAASLRGASLFPGMTATMAIILKQRFGVTLVPAGAVSYARQAAAAAGRGQGPLTASQVRDGMTLAGQMLGQLAGGITDVGADDATAGLLLEQVHGAWVVKPVVLGLTDGRSYEVLAGLRAGERVVTGVVGQATSATSATSAHVPGCATEADEMVPQCRSA
jgi:HlyD family secretion protein